MKPSEHINLVGILHIAWSMLLLVGACVLVFVIGVGGIFSGEEEAYIIVPIAMFVSALLSATAIAGFIGAYGVFKRRHWGRFTLMVLSAIWLVKIPVGTAMGVYSFWALTRDEVVAEFDGAASPSA